MGFGRAGDAGSLAHYDDPIRYSRRYRRRRHDVDYYRRAAQGEASLLEYGVGNGRVALPLARAGTHVTGVDLSQPMLDDLRRRLELEPRSVRERVTLVHGDMRLARLRRRFPLILAPFNTLLHLYTQREIEQFFSRVRAHLEPKGRFVFDISVPQSEDLSRDPDHAYPAGTIQDRDGFGLFSCRERFEYDPLRQLLVVQAEYSRVGARGRQQAFQVPLTQRQFFPKELEAWLHYNGFEVVDLVPDFGEPRAELDSLVFCCRLVSSK